MSNTTHEAKVIVTAQTEGAVAPLKEVAGATTEIVTAAKAAGAEQAELAKQMQAGKAKHLEMQAAIARVKQAQEEHNLTVRAFGPHSTEAAASQAKLTKALETAKTAAAECKQEVEQLKLGLAKTSAEADKASPALEKATKDLEKLNAAASKSDDELKKVELGMQAASKGGEKGGYAFGLMEAASGKLMSMLGPAALAGSLVAFAGFVSEAADETLRYDTALKNIPFSIEKAKAATGGLVDNMTLAKSAAQAVSLGVVKTEKDFNTLAEAATKIALRLGTDATQAIQDMTTALGRGSPLILDNLGVTIKVSEAQEKYARSIGTTVSRLTEEQKTLAFRESAMEALLKSANETVVAYDSSAAAVLRFKTSLANAWSDIKSGIANAAGAVIKPVLEMNDALLRAVETAKIMADPRGPLGVLADRMIKYAEATGGATNATYDFLAAQSMSAEEYARVQGAQDKERTLANRKRLEQERAAYVQTQRAEEAQLRETYAKRDSLWRERAAKDEEEARKEAERKKGKSKDKSFLDPGDVTIQRSYFGGSEDTDALVLDAEKRRDADREEMVAREIARREENIASIEREIEVRAAAGLDIEDLNARRMAAEDDLYAYTRAKSQQRQRLDENETRHHRQQHERRIDAAKKAAEKQAAWSAVFQQTISDTASNVGALTDTLMDAFARQAEGEKHAVAVSVEAYLAGLKRKMAAKAAEETVLGIAAAASYRYAAAAQHFAAAGMAAAIALGAFVGQKGVQATAEAGTGKSWSEIKQENADSGKKSDSKDTSKPSTGGKSDGGSSSSGRDGEKLEVPVSFEERRRDDASMSERRTGGGISLTFNVGGNIIGDGGRKELGRYVLKLIDETTGKRR